MQVLVAFLVLGTIVYAKHVQQFSGHNPAYGYIENIRIPAAERVRKAEEEGSKTVGAVSVPLGQYSFAAGIIAEIVTADLIGTRLCGGTLISTSRVLTAAFCWFDGSLQAWRLNIVLGSRYIFSGGTRIWTSTIALHHEVAIAYLSTPVSISDIIAPLALPSGSELFESFAGEKAIAVGFGISSDGSISYDVVLNDVNVSVITNSDCFLTHPFIQSSNICTSGPIVGGGFCNGWSGSSLIINRNHKQILIGLSLFGFRMDCQTGIPHASARITSFMDFINRNI